jgi:hypothetical protein
MCVVCSVPRVATCLVVETKKHQCATIYTPWDNYMTLRAELEGKAVNQIGLSTFMLFFAPFHMKGCLFTLPITTIICYHILPLFLGYDFRLLVREHIS